MNYGLIGNPLKHSFSKEIHESLGKYQYDLLELNEVEFIEFMQKKEFKAINVTIPYKQKVIPFLDVISDEAKKINAVNTIINKDGKLYGYNTDYYGFKDMLNHFNIDVSNNDCLILGTGATSKTVYHVLNDLNAKSITFVSRNKSDNCITYDELDNYKNVDIIVNTTPCEMFPNNLNKVIDIDIFSSLKGVCDVVYNPLRTNLIVSANERKIANCSGLYMLIAQAVYAMDFFLDKTFDKKIIDSFYKKLLSRKENIVLIGMPSSGKSTIGNLIASKLNREFYDVDEEIKKVIKMEISDYFKLYGEDSFRDLESKVIESLSLKNSIVIATGGGSILRNSNVKLLKQNGKLYFLNRSLDLLITTSSRPLSSNRNDLALRYKERYEKYINASDVIIDGNKDIATITKEICGGYNDETSST